MFKRLIVRIVIVSALAMVGGFVSTGVTAIVILLGIFWIIAGLTS